MTQSEDPRREVVNPPNYPILFGAAYLLLSVALYWVYFPQERRGIVVVYVFACTVALLIGSSVGNGSKVIIGRSRRPPRRLFLIACILTIAVSTINIATFYTSFNSILSFLLDPGKAYEYVKGLRRTGATRTVITNSELGLSITSLTFTKFVVFAWTPLYWRSLSKRVKMFSVATMLYYVVQSVLIGAMVNIATVALTTMTVFVVQQNHSLTLFGKRIVFRVLALFVVVGLALSFFLGSREEGVAAVDAQFSGDANGLAFYVSNGYVGLGYALEQPFVFTGGRTALYGMVHLFARGLPVDSYMVRVQEATGWSATQVWSTAAAWLASDITFPGVLALLVATGIWAGRLWRLSTVALDPFGILVLSQLIIGVFFFPANNHLLLTFGNASGFVILVALYVGHRWRCGRRSVLAGGHSMFAAGLRSAASQTGVKRIQGLGALAPPATRGEDGGQA